MQNIVRAFALSLVAVGAFASTHIAKDAQGATVTAKVSALPVPTCPPSDPNGCGIGQTGK